VPSHPSCASTPTGGQPGLPRVSPTTKALGDRP
jgi:hypothetical protein